MWLPAALGGLCFLARNHRGSTMGPDALVRRNYGAGKPDRYTPRLGGYRRSLL